MALYRKHLLTSPISFRFVQCAWRSSNRKMSWGFVHANTPFIGSKYTVLLTCTSTHRHTRLYTSSQGETSHYRFLYLDGVFPLIFPLFRYSKYKSVDVLQFQRLRVNNYCQACCVCVEANNNKCLRVACFWDIELKPSVYELGTADDMLDCFSLFVPHLPPWPPTSAEFIITARCLPWPSFSLQLLQE